MAQHSEVAEHHPREHAHPQPLEYVKIAVILCIITAAEVAVYYVPGLRGALVPILLTLSAIKFGLVVLWYMHLKFDSKLFSAIFFGGLVLAGAVLIALIFLFLTQTPQVEALTA